MLEEIKSRRSIRKFSDKEIDNSILYQIIEMGSWAPSGLNNQPWKFVIIRSQELRESLAQQTKYSHILRNAPVCISLFLDKDKGYNRVKDIQAIGAAAQNMLLSIHHLGLGGVWLGEILNNRDKVEAILEVPESCELMAVIAMGYPAEKRGKKSRYPVKELIISEK